MNIKILISIILYIYVCLSSYAINEEPIYLEEDCQPILFGGIKEREIYTLDNYSQDIKTSSANIDVITKDDIQRENNTEFSDILKRIGGVTVQNSNGSYGSPTSVRIRGTDRILFLLDGVRMDRPSLTSPTAQPQFFNIDDMKQIEVIKGAQGAILGSNASGGAISVQTKRGNGPIKFEFNSDMGNYSTFKERFAISGSNNKRDFYISTNWYKTDGGMRTSKLGKLDNDDYNNLSVMANYGQKFLDNKAELRNILRFSRARKGIGIGYDNLHYAYYNDSNNYSKNYDISDTLIWKHSPKDFYDYDMRFSFYNNIFNSYTLPDDISLDENERSKISSYRLNFKTQHNFKYKNWNTFSLGYNLENEHINGSSNSLLYGAYSPFPMVSYIDKYHGSTIQNDVYIHDVINIKDIFYLRSGARLSNNNVYGTYITPNGSGALILPTFKLKGAQTKFRASWGQSVNNPTLYQTYGKFSSGWITWIGNQNLKSEKYSSWDAGIEQTFLNDKLKFEFDYFNSNYHDYISAYYDIDYLTWMTTGYYQNIDEAKISGYEGKFTYEPNEKFKFCLNYTYTNSKDLSTGFELPATPKNRLNGTIYWTINDRIQFYTGLETSSSRTMSSASNESVPGYIDARIGTKIKLFTFKGVNTYLKGNIYNLFNQNICMYKNTLDNDYYYSPKIRFTLGLYFTYNLAERKKSENL